MSTPDELLQTLANAITRTEPWVEAVEIDPEDPAHVLLLGKPFGEGERVWSRLRLSAVAQQHLNGEFPELPEGGLAIPLFAPAPPGE